MATKTKSRSKRSVNAQNLHRCSDGRVIPHSKMSDSHLISSMQQYERWAAEDRGGADPVEIFPEYRYLREEAKRRGLL